MIKYNNSNINDWYYNTSDIIKVYRNGAVCYYKIVVSGGTSGQTPCFAVVEDISQYHETEFIDVFDKATEKWYKLNNLNQYEEYGVYGNSISGTSRLPQGYTEVEYIRQNSNYDAYINTGVILFDNTSNTYTVTTKLTSEFHSNLGCATIISAEVPVSPYNGMGYRYKCSSTVDQLEFFGGNSNYTSSVVDNGDGTRTVTFQSTGNTSWTSSAPLSLLCSFSDTSFTTPFRYADATIYSATIVKNGTTVRDFVPAKRDSDSVYGLYDLITDTFYTSPNGNNFTGGQEISNVVTYYEGKLAIVDGYEYIYSGSSWVNVGEVSGSTITIKSPEYIARTSSFNGYCSLLEYLTEDTKIIVKHRQTSAGGGSFIGDYFNNDNDDWRVFFASSTLYYDFITQRKSTRKTMPMSAPEEWEIGNYYVKNTATSTNLITGAHQSFSSRPNEMYLYYLGNYGNVSDYGEVYYIKIYRGETLVRDFIPWTDMNGNYGLYDKVEGELVHTVGNMTASTVINDVEVGGGIEYPLEYVVREDPPNNLSFSSMTEAKEYECPWVGMLATIDGDKYVFSGDSQSGYEWVYNPSRLPVGYTEVEYIQNTGTSYLNIAFTPNQDTRVVMQYQMVTDSGAGRFWGAGAWNSASGIEPNYEGGYLGISWLGKTSWTRYNNFPADYNKHLLDLNKNYLYLDETLVGSNTYTTRTASDPIGVFTYIGSGRPSSSTYWGIEHFKGKMFSFQIYDNGTLVRDLVPCVRDNDNTVGAYDIVNDVFYTVPTGYTTDKLIAGQPI